jgi:hypothetical protein
MDPNQHNIREREREREREIKLLPQTHKYRGGLLPLHHGGSVVDVGEVGEVTGDGFGSVSRSNIRRFSLSLMVSCFSATVIRLKRIYNF